GDDQVIVSARQDAERIEAALRLRDIEGAARLEGGGDEAAHGGGVLHHQNALASFSHGTILSDFSGFFKLADGLNDGLDRPIPFGPTPTPPPSARPRSRRLRGSPAPRDRSRWRAWPTSAPLTDREGPARSAGREA